MLPRRAATLAIWLASGFVLVLVALHGLEPEFDPSWRWISEYQLGRYGWVMSVAFCLWGSAAFALLVALWPSLRTGSGRLARGWLLLMSVALFGAGAFRTDPITATDPTVAGSLHGAFGMFTVLTFPAMATVVTGSLLRDPAWASARRRLLWSTGVIWLAATTFWSPIVIFLAVNQPASPFGPQVPAGWPNRAMVASYVLWLISVAWPLARAGRVSPAASPVLPASQHRVRDGSPTR